MRVALHFEQDRRGTTVEFPSPAARDEWQARVTQLEAQVRQLRAEAAADEPASGASLVEADLVKARVLGHQARRLLARRVMLGAGGDASLQTDALVLDEEYLSVTAATLIDRGADAGLDAGPLVLAHRNVLGKLADVGPHTSTVARLTDAGYRDEVRLVHDEGGTWRAGPRGLLVGTGESLCRIRFVAVNEPVAVGDVVFSDGWQGITNSPPCYGTVVRVERSAEAAEWEIWMQPAVDDHEPAAVDVIVGRLSRVHVARGQ